MNIFQKSAFAAAGAAWLAFAPPQANAMPVTTGLEVAGQAHDVRWVCGPYGRCRWAPGGYYRPSPYYRPRPFYGQRRFYGRPYGYGWGRPRWAY